MAAMAIQVASESSSLSFSGKTNYRYDVFLSFRGEDTRHSFTVLLYDALYRKGIKAFIDDKKLGKGEEISPTLLKAIEKSRISIIVFSKNYANSTWCLEELAHIVWCKNEKNQMVMPLFYKVHPDDVQYQRNSFGDAMAALEDRFRGDLKKVQKWRSALSEAARLSSAWLLEDGCDEGVFLKSIVEEAYAMLPPNRLHDPEHMFGLELRMEEVISILNQSDDRACMLGIHGAGGIGKTTLAKAVYNSIFFHFEGACFLFDVKEASKKYLGMVSLQQKLMSDILGEEKIMKFGSVDEGISRIKHRLSRKKILLVLDDVDEVEQLEQLAGGCDWFGYGSKVIITTRNWQLLMAPNVGKTYEMMKLNEDDSIALFSWHAFHMSQPPKTYQDMSSCAIRCANGLPLALRVIGSNLANKNLEEWMSILEQYERIPEKTILEVLKISYHGLPVGAKHIFLDIACFFHKVVHEDKEAIEVSDDFGSRFYLEVLVDKSLITLFSNGYLSMHDLIRQMGREIVRQEAPLNPEKRSRLWYYKDVLKVLRENIGCNNIEGIILDPPQQEKVEWDGRAFEKMDSLRILIVHNAQFSTGPTYLPNNLRWLEWMEYPSTTLPKDFSPLKLVALKLPRSSFRLKEPLKICTEYVTHMDFSCCEFIIEVPDASQLQSLKRLEFRGCPNLTKVHDSVGSLSRLQHLDVSDCRKLSSFPCEINMPSLEFLYLGRCRSLEYFPHVVEEMDVLRVIIISGSSIKELPLSFGNFSGLEYLYMDDCKRLSELPTSLLTLPNLGSLSLGDTKKSCTTKKSLMKLLMQNIQPLMSYHQVTYLSLTECGLMDEELRLILNCFPNLGWLYIAGNDFVCVPKCIKECAKLTWLDVSECKSLRHMPAEFPANWSGIVADNCTSLTAESLDNLYSQAKKEVDGLHVTMPRRNFPEWFDHCCEGGTLCFRVHRNAPPVALAVAVELGKANTNEIPLPYILININGRQMIPDYHSSMVSTFQGHVALVHLRSLPKITRQHKDLNTLEASDWNDVELQIIIDPPHISVESCGIYMYKPQTNVANVSRKRRAMIASPPNHRPPNKFLRIRKRRRLSNPKKWSRRIKRRQK